MSKIRFVWNRDPAFEPLIGLWVEAFEEPAEVFTGVWRGCPAGKRESFEAYEGTSLVGSVMAYYLDVVGPSGELAEMAGVANVSTLPSARGRGVSSGLLDLAVRSFGERGCSFSMLYTGIPDHYAKVGYVGFDEPIFEVVPSGGGMVRPAEIVDMGELARICALSPGKGLAMERPAAWWDAVVRPRLASRHTFVRGDAYAIIEGGNGDPVVFLEVEGDPRAVMELVAGVCEWGVGEGSTEFRSRVPVEGATVSGSDSGAMVLPVSLGLDECMSFVRNPDHVFRYLDHF